jgi:hypothetical protein
MPAISDAAQIRCDRCTNSSFDEIWRCARLNGNACGFQPYEHAQRGYVGGLLIFLFGCVFIFFGTFFALFMGRTAGTTWYSGLVLFLFLAVFLGFGGFVALLGLYRAFGIARSLCLPDSAWQESRILGIPLARRTVQRIGHEAALTAIRLSLPASIAGLTETPSWKDLKSHIQAIRAMPAEQQKQTIKEASADRSASDLVLGSVLDLLARGVLAASRVVSWTARFVSSKYKQGDEEIVLTLGPKFDPEDRPDGRLEQQIVNIVANWQVKLEAADQPLGPTGNLLVRSILGKSRTSAGAGLREIALQDAKARGMVVETSRWLHSFGFTDDVKASQAEDHRALVAWLRQNELQDYVQRLSKDIQAGIQSLESSD